MPIIDVGTTYEQAKESAEYKPLPEGTYLMEVEGLGKKGAYTSARGNVVIHLLFAVADGEHMGRTVSEFLTVGTRSWIEFCDATGFRWEGTSFAAEDLFGLKFYGVIEHEAETDRETGEVVENGRTFARIRNFLPARKTKKGKIPF